METPQQAQIECALSTYAEAGHGGTSGPLARLTRDLLLVPLSPTLVRSCVPWRFDLRA